MLRRIRGLFFFVNLYTFTIKTKITISQKIAAPAFKYLFVFINMLATEMSWFSVHQSDENYSHEREAHTFLYTALVFFTAQRKREKKFPGIMVFAGRGERYVSPTEMHV